MIFRRFMINITLDEIDERQFQKFELKKDLFLTQKDKVELIDRISNVEKSLTKTIYIVGLVQFLAIIASVLAIFNFMLK